MSIRVLPGGHCYYCHEDYPDRHSFIKCAAKNSANYYYPCDERCKRSTYYREV